MYNDSKLPIIGIIKSAENFHKTQLNYHQNVDSIAGAYGSYQAWQKLVDRHEKGARTMSRLQTVYERMHNRLAALADDGDEVSKKILQSLVAINEGSHGEY